jgi:hypothetical protein
MLRFSRVYLNNPNKLFLGLSLHGPICSVGTKIRPRPHMKTFMQYIAHLDIDITIFTAINEQEAPIMLDPWRDALFANRIYYNSDRHVMEDVVMTQVAEANGGQPSRILILSSEVERNIMPGQVIVVEKQLEPKMQGYLHDIPYHHQEKPYAILQSLIPENKRTIHEKMTPKDDFVCLALAEMIHELVQMEEMDVRDYIAMSPLIEWVKMPMLDHVRFLPRVSCLPYKDRLREFEYFAVNGTPMPPTEKLEGAGVTITPPSAPSNAKGGRGGPAPAAPGANIPPPAGAAVGAALAGTVPVGDAAQEASSNSIAADTQSAGTGDSSTSASE